MPAKAGIQKDRGYRYETYNCGGRDTRIAPRRRMRKRLRAFYGIADIRHDLDHLSACSSSCAASRSRPRACSNGCSGNFR